MGSLTEHPCGCGGMDCRKEFLRSGFFCRKAARPEPLTSKKDRMTANQVRELLEQCEDLLRDKTYYLQSWGTPTYYALLEKLEKVTADETDAGLRCLCRLTIPGDIVDGVRHGLLRCTAETTAAVRCRQCAFEDQAVDNAPGGFHEPGCPRAPAETPEAPRCKTCGEQYRHSENCLACNIDIFEEPR